MTDTTRAARLEEIIDKDEIRDVLMRYSRGVDRHDRETLRSCYHVDSYDDHGHWKGNGQDFADFIIDSLTERTHTTSHSVANILIEIDPENRHLARSEAYSFAYLRRTDESGKEWLDVFAGRYVDQFERRNGAWRIANRVVVHDWSASTPLVGDNFPLEMSGFTEGRRDLEDLIYLI